MLSPKVKTMMNLLTETDFVPIEGFDLKWRFTEERHRLLPKEDLSQIQPLSKSKASDFNKYSRKYLANATLLKSEFDKIETFQILKDHEDARSWLKARQINSSTRIFVSWDSSSCVATSWEVFCKYWADFCYPSSDDVLIWREKADWFLYYCHHEIFEFGMRKL